MKHDDPLSKETDWLYIYKLSGEEDRIILYDRSMPFDCTRQADARIRELQTLGFKAFYTRGFVLPQALS